MIKEQVVIPIKRKVMVGIPIHSPEVELIRKRISEDIGINLPKMAPHFTLIPPKVIQTGEDFLDNAYFLQCCDASVKVASKTRKTSVKCLGYKRFRSNMLYIDVNPEPIKHVYNEMCKIFNGFNIKLPSKTTPHLTLVKDCIVNTNKILDFLEGYSQDPVKHGFPVDMDRICVYTKVDDNPYLEKASYELIG